jgi:outer membrane protein assembly factor BamB
MTQIDSGSYIAASAAFLDGEVYVGNYDNVFMKADITAGKVVWEYTESDAPFFSSPAVGEDVVVFGGRDEKVHCVRREDGKVVWTFQTRGEVDSSPVICGDKVVVGSEDGRLYMIRLSDGSLVWSYEIGQPVTSSPAVAGGMVIVGSDDGYVYAFGAAR